MEITLLLHATKSIEYKQNSKSTFNWSRLEEAVLLELISHEDLPEKGFHVGLLGRFVHKRMLCES